LFRDGGGQKISQASLYSFFRAIPAQVFYPNRQAIATQQKRTSLKAYLFKPKMIQIKTAQAEVYAEIMDMDQKHPQTR